MEPINVFEIEEKPINPWLGIWFKPSQTIQQFVISDHKLMIIILAITSGMSQIIEKFFQKNIGEQLSGNMILFIIIVLGSILGVLSLYLSSALVYWTGKWFNGQATFEVIKRAISLSFMPHVFIIALWILAGFIFGDHLFRASLTELTDSGFMNQFYSGFMFVITLLSWWSVYLTIKAISTVQRIGFISALFNYLTSAFVLIIPIMLIVYIV